jgi:two-component system, sensor histidine kinase and response regulator
VRSSLRGLLLAFTSAAIAAVTLGELAFNVKTRTQTAEVQLAEQTERLLAASRPLLLNALVVEDLASVEQTLRNLNADRVWRQVRLYEHDGRTLMLDASPPTATARRAPGWFGRLLHLDLAMARTEISAKPTVYGVLAVMPSSDAVIDQLWVETRTMVTTALVLLAVLIVLVHVILTYGLRSIKALGTSATRVGGGDLTVRMPPTRLSEIAPTVQAFNAMAENLEKLLAELRAKEQANRRLVASVEQAEDAILTIDLEGCVTSWNLGARHLFDRSTEQVLGRPLAELFEGAASEAAAKARRLMETRPPSRMEFALPRPRGAPVVVAGSSSPLHDEADRDTGYLVVARDVTVRVAAETALRQAKEAAEAANRAKAEFLATMSHEIRTPMNGIMGMTEILLGSEMTDEQRECARLVKSSAQALLQIIDDILDFSKIDAGRVELESIPFDLRTTLTQAIKPLARQAAAKGLELVGSVHPDVPERVVGDPGRLRQVLMNLVGNAVKFTEVGEVVMRIEPEGGAGETRLHFVVRDTGIGVPTAKRDAVFEAFTQADGSTTRRYGGTGLGLPISKRLVELMRGRMWLESEEGRGSAFHFVVPFEFALAAPPENAQLVSLDGLAVLAVDDNAASRGMLEETLTAWRLNPTVVSTAAAALAAVEEAKAAGCLPAVVITDHVMPGLDGLGLASRLKSDPGLAAIPVIMLSSVAQPGDWPIARQAGIRALLTKPVTRSELLNAVMSVLGSGRAALSRERAMAATPAPTPAGRQLRVLVAEDNSINQRVARALLERQGHRVEVVATGRAAVEALQARPFDLVLMDIEMPELDGFEATTAIRGFERDIEIGARQAPPDSAYAVPRPGALPIIALTAHAMKGMGERCRAAGMDGFLSKPIRPEHLVDTLAKFAAEMNGQG